MDYSQLKTVGQSLASGKDALQVEIWLSFLERDSLDALDGEHLQLAVF